MATMSRSAHGLEGPRGDNWRARAACRHLDPETWFDADLRPMALHICRRHCPVLQECRLNAFDHPPVSGVQGGVAFGLTGKPYADSYTTPAPTCPRCPKLPPREPSTDTGACGTYRGYRRHLRRREDGCDACRAAAVRRWRDQRRKRLSTAVDGPVGVRKKRQKEI